jgi:DNA-binding beta-propeller fold protein YncE
MGRKIVIITIAGLIFLILFITLSISWFPGYNISIDGKLLVVNKLDHSVSIFELASGREISLLSFLEEPHEAIGLEYLDYAIISNYGNIEYPGRTLSLVSFQSGEIIRNIDLGEGSRPHGLAIIREQNKVLVTTEGKNSIMLVNLENGFVEKTISTQQDKPHLIVVHPEGKTAYCTNFRSNSVSEININNGIVLRTFSCGNGAEGIDISPDGTELWVANKFDNTITIIYPKMIELTQILKTNNSPVRLKFTLDGAFCLVNNATSGNVLVFNTFTKKVVQTIHLPGNRNFVDRLFHHSPHPVGILMHPNGKFVFVSDSNSDQVYVIEISDWKLVGNLSTGRIPDGMVCSIN